ncbi:hypothetical protein RJJ37_25035 [Rhizobium redzepovicii]|uniref:Uncharacterized protein n=1 Tax=Rhizobium redzepovicii TaxID=2867518 RepID=A0AAW8P713_9HYPH|nr:hypothetical protein [Rhizobium redzepovicii]
MDKTTSHFFAENQEQTTLLTICPAMITEITNAINAETPTLAGARQILISRKMHPERRLRDRRL